MYVKIKDLKFPELSAEGNDDEENKNLFLRTFYPTDSLEKILEPNKYFLLGDKGVGKTAYAKYIKNKNESHHVSITTLEETDYERFVRLRDYFKHTESTVLDSYKDVWRLLLMLLIAEEVVHHEKRNKRIFGRGLTKLEEVLKTFYTDKTLPVLLDHLKIIEKHNALAEAFGEANLGVIRMGAQHGNDASVQKEYSRYTLSNSSHYISKEIIECFENTNLTKPYIFFIDGIDVRPSTIKYNEYVECIRGLVHAAMQLNKTYLKVNKGVRKVKIVLLMRPDIYDEVSLHNPGLRLINNTVILDWAISIYDHYERAPLFKLADQILAGQQKREIREQLKPGDAWNYYFPYAIEKHPSKRKYEGDTDGSFVGFLRHSLHRPRDIIATLTFLVELHPPISKNESHLSDSVFEYVNFSSQRFIQRYAAYLRQELNENLAFYQDRTHFDMFLEFFNHLRDFVKSNQFSYNDYCKAFDSFDEYRREVERSSSPKNHEHIYGNRDKFLQFLFELNIIGFILESSTHGHFQKWYFKRNLVSDTHQKVRRNCNYKLHNSVAYAVGLYEADYSVT